VELRPVGEDVTVELELDEEEGAVRELGRATRQEVAAHLDWPINRVTGRVTELLSANAIEECGTDRSTSRPRGILKVSRRRVR